MPLIESEAQFEGAPHESLRRRRRLAPRPRVAKLSTRSIKKSTKLAAIDMAISMVDLTTLEGADTPGRVTSLCTKAMRPDPRDLTVPSVAAVCVYPDLVAHARSVLGTSTGRRGVGRHGVPFRTGLAQREVDGRARRGRAPVPTRSTW